MSELIVFDTNIFVSYFWTLNKPNKIKTVVERIHTHKVVPVYSDDIMAEYREVLGRRKFGFSQQKVLSFLQLIIEVGQCVRPVPTTVRFVDLSDKCFYDAALKASAHWLVTGNVRYFPAEPFIVSPAEYLEHTQG